MSSHKEKSLLPPQQATVKVLSNRYISSGCYRLVVKSPSSFLQATPGQFVNVRIDNDNGLRPLLRRPFSINDITSQGIKIIYKIVGKGTNILSGKKMGNHLDVLGPLGRGFSVCKEAKKHLLIGGGMGAAPLLFLARKIGEKGRKDASTLAFLGFETAEKIICREDFAQKNIPLQVATEDGSYGHKGLVSRVVESYVEGLSSTSGVSIYACGPREMLKVVAEVGSRYAIFSQVLMEEIIGCGVGACRGCVIKGNAGYLRVCKDGPVFNARDILWS